MIQTFKLKKVIRFVQIKGIYHNDKKAFGFVDTVTNKFIEFSGNQFFDSFEDFTLCYEISKSEIEFNRLFNLIHKKWFKVKLTKP